MIETSLHADAEPGTVHRLLVEISAWALWSPHVASVSPSSGEVRAGDVVATRAFFAPAATPMQVDTVTPDGGMTWHTTALGHRLSYENRIAPAPQGGSTLTWSARIDGPAAGLLTTLTAPLSRLGQRRRMARLAALAALVDEQRGRTATPQPM